MFWCSCAGKLLCAPLVFQGMLRHCLVNRMSRNLHQENIRYLANTISFYMYIYSIKNTTAFIVNRHEGGRKEMFYLTTHSTHFIYGYMASYIW